MLVTGLENKRTGEKLGKHKSLFNKYLSSVYCLLGSMLSPGDPKVSKRHMIFTAAGEQKRGVREGKTEEDAVLFTC